MPEVLQRILVELPLLLLAVSAHEAAHAWAAARLGDTTAREQGRETLLPFPHLDLFGSVLLPAALLLSQSPLVFGYAKPTPVDPGRLRHPKRDFSLVALAGPAANWALAVAFALLGAAMFRGLGVEAEEAQALVGAGIVVNVVLGWINLMPLPGFDGLKALYAVLPDEWCWRLQRGGRWFLPVLVMVLLLGWFDWALAPAAVAGGGLCALAGARPPTL